MIDGKKDKKEIKNKQIEQTSGSSHVHYSTSLDDSLAQTQPPIMPQWNCYLFWALNSACAVAFQA
jgi:hypothetical protein